MNLANEHGGFVVATFWLLYLQGKLILIIKQQLRWLKKHRGQTD